MSGSSSAKIRGSGIGRGGRGGFVPKKAVLEAMRARYSLSNEASKKAISEVDASRVLEKSINETIEPSKDWKRDCSDIVDYSDDDGIPCCDLCCEPNHRTRFCPIFNKPKSVEQPSITCYYCKKPGHIKSECPKKNRNNHSSSRNFGKNGNQCRNQCRNLSETASGNHFGAPVARVRNWSVVQANNQFKDANFVPMPVQVSSAKLDSNLRPQFLPSQIVVGKNLAPEYPPKSRINYNRSDSEDYEDESVQEEGQKSADDSCLDNKAEKAEENSKPILKIPDDVSIELKDEVKDTTNVDMESNQDVSFNTLPSSSESFCKKLAPALPWHVESSTQASTSTKACKQEMRVIDFDSDTSSLDDEPDHSYVDELTDSEECCGAIMYLPVSGTEQEAVNMAECISQEDDTASCSMNKSQMKIENDAAESMEKLCVDNDLAEAAIQKNDKDVPSPIKYEETDENFKSSVFVASVESNESTTYTDCV